MFVPLYNFFFHGKDQLVLSKLPFNLKHWNWIIVTLLVVLPSVLQELQANFVYEIMDMINYYISALGGDWVLVSSCTTYTFILVW